MKTFNKTFLPELIEYKGCTYHRNIAMSSGMNANNTPLSVIAATLKKEGRKAVCVKVLSRELRGKLNLHNKPYEPTTWIFTTEPAK